MAIVFKAKARDGKAAPIAVRVVSHHFGHDGASHQQSTQSLLTSHMEGDGFVRVYSHEVIPLLDIEYWLMEYVRSVSLRQVMPTLGKFPVVLTLNYLIQIAEVLARAHHNGIAHGNLHPGNIYINARNRIYLSPFVQRASVSGRQLYTRDQIRYLSPEQLSDGDGQESSNDLHLSDQYALGILAHSMLTGQTHRQGLRWSPADEKRIPAGLRRTVERLLRPDPRRRFSTIDDLITKLKAIQPPLNQAEESLRRCLDTDFARHFYQRFFADYPEVEKFFPEARLVEQYLYLRVALHLLLRHSEGELLEQVALKHATRPISRDMYCAFEEVLLKTVETTDTKIIAATTAERTRLLTAWRTALRDGMNYMKEYGVGSKNRGME
jgi:serine/threonine protein kinase